MTRRRAAQRSTFNGLERNCRLPSRPMTVENKLAAQIVGIREDGQPFDSPSELGFHSPVFKFGDRRRQDDERIRVHTHHSITSSAR
jgi:hypothetical protein